MNMSQSSAPKQLSKKTLGKKQSAWSECGNCNIKFLIKSESKHQCSDDLIKHLLKTNENETKEFYLLDKFALLNLIEQSKGKSTKSQKYLNNFDDRLVKRWSQGIANYQQRLHVRFCVFESNHDEGIQNRTGWHTFT